MAEEDRTTAVRKGQGSTKLTKEEFQRRVRERFYDPAFGAVSEDIDRIIDIAWDGYDKTPEEPAYAEGGRA